MNQTVALLSVLGLFTTISSAHALTPSESAYYEISSVKTVVKAVEDHTTPLTTIDSDLGVINESLSTTSSPTSEGGPLAIADIFFKAWDIIKDGAPVVNVKYKNVTALPNIANQNWATLTGWQSERVITFGVSTENGFGITTVDLEYQVKLIYGGNYHGKGKYIASARVVPTKVDVKWGYNLDVSVEVPSILNLASESDPLAAINLDVTYKVSTILRSYSEAQSYELRRNGLLKDQNKTYFKASL